MAIQNTLKLNIDNVDYSKKLVLPIDIGQFLDERLDEINLSLRCTKKDYFMPGTVAILTLNNSLYFGNYKENLEEKTLRFIIANDKAVEMPNGSEFYNHELYLIEETKYLECFVCDTLTFTNVKGSNYGESYNVVGCVRDLGKEKTFISNFYKSPCSLLLDLQSIEDFNNDLNTKLGEGVFFYKGVEQFIKVEDANSNIIYSEEVYRNDNYEIKHIIYENGNLILDETLSSDYYSIPERQINLPRQSYYSVLYQYALGQAGTGRMSANIDIICLENKLPLKQLTITDVANRILDVVEPIEYTPNLIPFPYSNSSKTENGLTFTIQDDGGIRIYGTPTGYAALTLVNKSEITPSKTYTISFGLDTNLRSKNLACTINLYDKNSQLSRELTSTDNSYTFTALENECSVTIVIKRNNNNIAIDATVYPILVEGNEINFNKPRFHLDGVIRNNDCSFLITSGSLAEKLNKILSPEFAFTRKTLRECLQQIGGFIHAEPRLINGDTITFDFYGENKYATIKNAYSKKELSHTLERFCTNVDSSAQNLVNKLDYAQGVVCEPCYGGFKSVRTETNYIRITEENMLIETQMPIYEIEKVICGLVNSNGNITQQVDITSFIFAKSIYDSQLSSYKSIYPYSKAFGLYFSKGSKNIQGLNFKIEDSISPYFQKYAIVNILRQAIGNNNFNIDAEEYPELTFQVSYVPIYNSRISHNKPYIGEYNKPFALIYNQNANLIETKYYGENIKGAVARMGNVEKTITYLFSKYSQIPKVGQLFDKNFYISAVHTTVYPTCFVCTLALSKDFNRLSQYVAISSENRYYEVSENQTYDRNLIYKNYIVVSDNDSQTQIDGGIDLFGIDAMYEVLKIFRDIEETTLPISYVVAYGESFNGNKMPTVKLPVISSALGNVMTFSWAYKDNYSAGSQAIKVDNSVVYNSRNVTGYWQNEYAYNDYYGKIYKYYFGLFNNTDTPNLEKALSYPEGKVTAYDSYIIGSKNFGTDNARPIVLRKDSREVLQFNVQIEFVTDNEDIIIGSALASNCSLVKGYSGTNAPKLYVFDKPINKFTKQITDLNNNDGFEITATRYNSPNINITSTPNISGKAWAIITPTTSENITVEDEFGNVETQTVIKGGDILIAKNTEVNANETISVWLNAKNKIYN